MKKNEGMIDRVLRVILGLVVVSLALIGPKTPWGYLGFIFVVTGLLGWCPIYKIVGLSTCPLSKKD